MEQVILPVNLQAAWKRVRKNKGCPGVDGMPVEEWAESLQQHGAELCEQLLSGTYQPQPVKRVEIPKPGGGVRQLGIPTVVDRFIQQALLQVLQPRIDPSVSPHSYGFRPGRSAHDAVQQAQRYIQAGRKWVVDVDLEKFLDASSQCPLVHERVSNRQGWVLTTLIRKPFLLPRRI
jgi:RNA-directed DNA polymerase